VTNVIRRALERARAIFRGTPGRHSSAYLIAQPLVCSQPTLDDEWSELRNLVRALLATEVAR
jgi:hypothetical protein